MYPPWQEEPVMEQILKLIIIANVLLLKIDAILAQALFSHMG